ncbi:helix-turn-helix domain-containing protein [Streptomyces sp. NBRC 109706]|uniref:helix-turn-helix domain-containing protein n=1 Tax=Streptomyces sp. NBRC 109706 TaxID=1550035 RepID=UPI00099DB540|nr:helix-turn-helix transcriptional regulator [Streptomyces sp. NBRC 109706]
MTVRKYRKRGSPLDHDPEALRWARQHAGLTQQQLADRAGIACSLVRDMENGRRNATPENRARLAGALGCPPMLLERKEPAEGAPVLEVLTMDARR